MAAATSSVDKIRLQKEEMSVINEKEVDFRHSFVYVTLTRKAHHYPKVSRIHKKT
jgi:hypothetical protein